MKKNVFKRLITGISLIYTQSIFASGGLIPKINGADEIKNGSNFMVVLGGWVKAGLLTVLFAASIFLITKGITTVITGLKRAQEDDGSVTTMLNYLVSSFFAISVGLVGAYLGYEIYSNFKV